MRVFRGGGEFYFFCVCLNFIMLSMASGGGGAKFSPQLLDKVPQPTN